MRKVSYSSKVANSIILFELVAKESLIENVMHLGETGDHENISNKQAEGQGGRTVSFQ